MLTHLSPRGDANQVHLVAPVRALVTLWILISPWVLFITGVATPSVPAAINHFVVGMVLMLVSMVAGNSPKVSEASVNFAGGVWLLFAPWLLGYGGSWSLELNSVISGAVLIALSGWESVNHRRSLRR